jgi:hypothetical protein
LGSIYERRKKYFENPDTVLMTFVGGMLVGQFGEQVLDSFGIIDSKVFLKMVSGMKLYSLMDKGLNADDKTGTVSHDEKTFASLVGTFLPFSF